MWPSLKLTSLSDSLYGFLFRLLFRYDIFISYARGDGKEYASKLRDQLRQLDFSCFLDFDELPAGNSLNNNLKRAIKKSATLVVVGTERAVHSRYVDLEIGEFARTGRAIIPIDIEGTLAERPWRIIKDRDIVWIDEVKSALTKGVPSPTVADSIDRLFKYTRRNSRVRAQVLSTIILFAVVIGASIVLIQQNVKAARTATTEAGKASAEAKINSAKAEAEKRTAVEATKLAKSEKMRAETAQQKATTAEKAAVAAAENAKAQQRIALLNAERAKKQQLIAEERTNYLQAQQVAVQANTDIDNGNDLERSVLLSVESLKKALTPEGYFAWARGMDLVPHAAEEKFPQQTDNVTAIAYSQDGRFFAEGSGDGAVTFFQTAKPQPVRRQLRSGNEIKVISFGRDWVAAASQNEFKMWNLEEFAEIRSSEKLSGFHGESIAFSPDGRYVATGGSVSNKAVLRVFDITHSTTKIQTTLDHVGYVMSVAFSPNGKWLAIGCHYKNYEVPPDMRKGCEKTSRQPTSGKVLILDTANFDKSIEVARNPVTSVTEEELIYRINFGPKGDHLATEDIKGTVRIWQVFEDERGIDLRPSQTEKMKVGALEVVRVGVAKGGGLNFANQSVGRSTLVFSPDESYVATAPDQNTARVWEVSTGREVSRIVHEQPVEAIAFDPAGQFATTSGKVKFWKTEFGSEARRLSYANDKSAGLNLAALAISPKGDWLVTGNEDGIHVYSTTDWSQKKWLEKGGPVSKLSFTSDGQWLVAARRDGLSVIETKQWQERTLSLRPSDQEPAEASILGFSPNRRWLVTVDGALLKLFEVGSWTESTVIRTNNRVNKVAFSSDSRWLAAEVESKLQISSHLRAPNEIYIWDAASGTPVACKANDKDTESANEPEPSSTFPEQTVCSKVTGAKQEIGLAAIRKWKEPLEFNLISGASPDNLWSVGDNNGAVLNYNEEKTSVQVAQLMQGYWTFTPDSSWLVIAGGNRVSLWPLNSSGMIDEACGRLHRRDLTLDEWKQHFSAEKLQPTCTFRGYRH